MRQFFTIISLTIIAIAFSQVAAMAGTPSGAMDGVSSATNTITGNWLYIGYVLAIICVVYAFKHYAEHHHMIQAAEIFAAGIILAVGVAHAPAIIQGFAGGVLR